MTKAGNDSQMTMLHRGCYQHDAELWLPPDPWNYSAYLNEDYSKLIFTHPQGENVIKREIKQTVIMKVILSIENKSIAENSQRDFWGN